MDMMKPRGGLKTKIKENEQSVLIFMFPASGFRLYLKLRKSFKMIGIVVCKG